MSLRPQSAPMGWFEPDMAYPPGDVTILHGFLVRLMIILHITETLDLNTRIGTKD